MTLKSFAILGERCSGTNYLSKLLEINFELSNVNNKCCRNKHWFPWKHTPLMSNCLFVGISRQYDDWLASLYRNPWHLEPSCCDSWESLNSKPIRSYSGVNSMFVNRDTRWRSGLEKPCVNNLIEEHADIRELRDTKLKYLTQQAKHDFPYYFYIEYEYLRDNWKEVLLDLQKQFNLSVTERFPCNWLYYKDTNQLWERSQN